MDVNAYAASVGRAHKTVHDEVCAARVAADAHARTDDFRTLVAIHAAPRWLWRALVAAMVEGKWTVEATRKEVARLKDIAEPPAYLDVAAALLRSAAR